MAIFDIFKKKKKPEKPQQAEKPPKAAEKKEHERAKKAERPAREKTERKPEKKEEAGVPAARAKRKETGLAPLVLKSAQVTEKATALAGNNQYVFKVFPQTTKQEIKRAVEEAYGVEVRKVRKIKVRRKRRRLARSFGWRKGYQKAIVALKPGQKIEILPR